MYSLSLDTNKFKIDAQFGVEVLPNNPDIIKALESFLILNEKVPIVNALLELSGGVDYNYSFTTKDGRVWEQIISMDIPNDPLLKATMDFFRFSEVELHTNVRNILQSLINNYSLSGFEITFY